MDNNWQVCSLVVQAKSQHINDIATQLRSFSGCEVALSDVESGQLIVVVEAEQSETLMKTICSTLTLLCICTPTVLKDLDKLSPLKS